MVWCEFPTSDRAPVERFTWEVRKRFPKAIFAFNWSSSFKWFNDPNPLRFSELGEMGMKFIFITLGGQHAMGYGFSQLLQAMAEKQEEGYIELQKKEWAAGTDFVTRSHHQFSGVPYHHLIGKQFNAARLGKEFCEELPEEKVV
jgi:isocitrate lyase